MSECKHDMENIGGVEHCAYCGESELDIVKAQLQALREARNWYRKQLHLTCGGDGCTGCRGCRESPFDNEPEEALEHSNE